MSPHMSNPNQTYTESSISPNIQECQRMVKDQLAEVQFPTGTNIFSQCQFYFQPSFLLSRHQKFYYFESQDFSPLDLEYYSFEMSILSRLQDISPLDLQII